MQYQEMIDDHLLERVAGTERKIGKMLRGDAFKDFQRVIIQSCKMQMKASNRGK